MIKKIAICAPLTPSLLLKKACSNNVVAPSAENTFKVVTTDYYLNKAYKKAQVQAGEVYCSQHRSLRLIEESSQLLWKSYTNQNTTFSKYYQVTLAVGYA